MSDPEAPNATGLTILHLQILIRQLSRIVLMCDFVPVGAGAQSYLWRPAMMATNLQDAISRLLEKVQADGSVLDVADAAIKLAKEFGGNSREIAILITEGGLIARLNMYMSVPASSCEPLRKPSVVRPPAQPRFRFVKALDAA
jgi:hypothetical protein